MCVAAHDRSSSFVKRISQTEVLGPEWRQVSRVRDKLYLVSSAFPTTVDDGSDSCSWAVCYCRCWRKCANGETAEWNVAHNLAASLKRKPNRLTSTLAD
jgi:hypothetical protein